MARNRLNRFCLFAFGLLRLCWLLVELEFADNIQICIKTIADLCVFYLRVSFVSMNQTHTHTFENREPPTAIQQTSKNKKKKTTAGIHRPGTVAPYILKEMLKLIVSSWTVTVSCETKYYIYFESNGAQFFKFELFLQHIDNTIKAEKEVIQVNHVTKFHFVEITGAQRRIQRNLVHWHFRAGVATLLFHNIQNRIKHTNTYVHKHPKLMLSIEWNRISMIRAIEFQLISAV